MEHHNLEAESGKLTITGTNARLTVRRGAESWQFFAFIFAATVTFAFALIDEIDSWRWRVVLKIFSFLVIGYITLMNERFRDWQARLLQRFKEERS